MTIGRVRQDYAISLANEEDAGARSAALIVTVLEYYIAKSFVRSAGRRRTVQTQLTGLMSTNQLEVDIPPLLRSARRIARGCLQDAGHSRGDLLRDLRDLQRQQPQWEGVIDAISELSK